MSWLRGENFGNLEQHLKAHKLKTFLELSGKVYPDLVKVFYTNPKFSNGILKTSVKGVEMEITRQTWKDVSSQGKEVCKFAKVKLVQWMNSTKCNTSTNVCVIKVSKL